MHRYCLTCRLTSHLSEAEPPAGSSSEPGAAVGHGLQDEDRAKPPARAPKTLSSFFGAFLLPDTSRSPPRAVQGAGRWHFLQTAADP